MTLLETNINRVIQSFLWVLNISFVLFHLNHFLWIITFVCFTGVCFFLFVAHLSFQFLRDEHAFSYKDFSNFCAIQNWQIRFIILLMHLLNAMVISMPISSSLVLLSCINLSVSCFSVNYKLTIFKFSLTPSVFLNSIILLMFSFSPQSFLTSFQSQKPLASHWV